MFQDDGGQGGRDDDFDGIRDTGAEQRPDMRPIMRPCATEEYVADKGDILDLVRRRIEERAIKPIDIRRAGLSRWNAEKHWRLRDGSYDCNISQRLMYQLCTAVGLRRTKQLPRSL